MRNIEIKARVRDWPRLERELRALRALDAGTETQHDIFYAAARGRLKLRRSSRDGAALIHYERADGAVLRPSDYLLVRVADGDALERVLGAALERTGEVHKRRHLHLVDNVRVHLDEVDGLGKFLELEAVVDDSHPESACRALASDLLQRFGIAPGDHLSVAYVDLLSARSD